MLKNVRTVAQLSHNTQSSILLIELAFSKETSSGKFGWSTQSRVVSIVIAYLYTCMALAEGVVPH
jgi:hypothetical protein